jgi:hypothetical protein
MTEALDIHGAMAALREGHHVRRAGWNADNSPLFLYLNQTGRAVAKFDPDTPTGGVDLSALDLGNPATVARMRHINGRRANGSTFSGWIATHADLTADDWTVMTVVGAEGAE